MDKKQSRIIEKIKERLLESVDEWVGSDIPEEGDEDFDAWQLKLDSINDVRNIRDVIDVLESSSNDLESFFVSNSTQLISAGLDPADVPIGVVAELGEKVFEKSSSDRRSRTFVYLYDKTHFVVTKSISAITRNKRHALKAAGGR